MDEITQAAVADLATKLGIDESGVEVISSDAVTWRDGSLGCPKKGMAYIQMLVPGYLVILEANGSSYRYHAGQDGAPFPCAAAEAQDPLPPSAGPA